MLRDQIYWAVCAKAGKRIESKNRQHFRRSILSNVIQNSYSTRDLRKPKNTSIPNFWVDNKPLYQTLVLLIMMGNIRKRLHASYLRWSKLQRVEAVREEPVQNCFMRSENRIRKNKEIWWRIKCIIKVDKYIKTIQLNLKQKKKTNNVRMRSRPKN